MPELPEVETIVRQLNKKVIGLKILDAWTDWPRTIKTHSLIKFKKEIKGLKILRAHRRAKYIMMDLSEGKTLIIHQKISGHLLYGKWIEKNQISNIKNQNYKLKIKNDLKLKNQKWVGLEPEALWQDPFNRHIRFLLFLNNGKMLGLSDLRRFGKVFLGDTEKIEHINEIGRLGPEPLDAGFNFKKFRELFRNKKGKIKQVLMDPFFIVGIGNIYSDEILWFSGIHPEHRTESLKEAELKKIFKYMKSVLNKAIDAKGDSQQDYRTLDGGFGNYQNMTMAYQMTGEKCKKHDGGVIKRIKVGSRSAHFCPVHQK
ncbi:MAG: bifunctional DNA-formamidopyrimidine glycosylase/DNA-(apurinic or apyrimidinic site) lyase [bacterium]|nr:bifunctional DNA-formamidopyrimidine glycosylase/DNA-(apurinic or apyrimidinic site) lyase [bacterium]